MTKLSDSSPHLSTSDETPAQSALQSSLVPSHIVEQGARLGRISYGRINEMLGETVLDEDQTEALFEALEARGVQVGDDFVPQNTPDSTPRQATGGQAETAAKSASAKSATANTKRPAKSLRTSQAHGNDADAALASGKKEDDVKASRHRDLDAVLASLDEMMNSPLGAIIAEDMEEPETKRKRGKSSSDVGDGSGASNAADELSEVPADASVEDALTQYMNQMGRVPLLDEVEEKRLARLVRSGTAREQNEAREKLIESNLRLVVHLARRYAGRAALPLLDLVQEGNLGLMRAVESFDPERGRRLSSYATKPIRESINRAIAAQSRSIRLPGHLSAAIQKLQRLQRELSQSLGRSPSRDELAKAAGMTHLQVEEALRASSEPLSLEAHAGGNDEDGNEFGDSLSDDSEVPISALSKTELQEGISRTLQTLSDRERAVILQRFGLGQHAANGPQAIEDIAARMKLSRERVHRLEVRALRKMRRRTKGTPLDDSYAGDDV